MPTDTGQEAPKPNIPQPDIAQAPEAAVEKPAQVTKSATQAIDSVLKDGALSVWEENEISDGGLNPTFFSFFDPGQTAKFDQAAEAYTDWYLRGLDTGENLYQDPEGDKFGAEVKVLEPRFDGGLMSKIYGGGRWITDPQHLLDAELYRTQMVHEAEDAMWAEFDRQEEVLRELEEEREYEQEYGYGEDEDDEDPDFFTGDSMGYEAAPFGEEDDERAMAELRGDKAWVVTVSDKALEIAKRDGRGHPEEGDFNAAMIDLGDRVPKRERDALNRDLAAIEQGRSSGN